MNNMTRLFEIDILQGSFYSHNTLGRRELPDFSFPTLVLAVGKIWYFILLLTFVA